MRLWRLRSWLPLLSTPACLDAAASSRGGSRACIGDFDLPVVNLCPDHWPDSKAERVWMVLFYAPWCGHCQTMKPKYEEMARMLKDDDRGLVDARGIGIGALECSEPEHQGLCQRYNITGYPTLKSLVAGKVREYNGARELAPMKAFILRALKARGSKGGSGKCHVGLFGNRTRDSVVPLCDAHFPDYESKNGWIVVFYDSQADSKEEVRRIANQASEELGNEPPGWAREQRQKPLRRKDRMQSLLRKYKLTTDMPKKGTTGTQALAKVGAVCCDCGASGGLRLCREHTRRPRPAVAWADYAGVQVNLARGPLKAKYFMEVFFNAMLDSGVRHTEF